MHIKARWLFLFALAASAAHAVRPASEREAQQLRTPLEDPTRGGCKYNAGALPVDTIGAVDIKNVPIPLGEDIPIQYIWVVMQENRSFDNYFGRFPAYLKEVLGHTAEKDPRLKPFANQGAVEGVEVPGTPYDLLSAADKLKADASDTPNANTRLDAPYNPSRAGFKPDKDAHDKLIKHYWKHHSWQKEIPGLCVSDTPHEWWGVHLQWNRGRMDGFYQTNEDYWEGGSPVPGGDLKTAHKGNKYLTGERGMYFYDESDIPFYYWLADQFAIGDHYFSSVLGPTYVNRDYLYGATSRGLTCNASNTYLDGLTGNPNVFAGNVADTHGKKGESLVQQLNSAKITLTRWARARYSGVPIVISRYAAWSGNANPMGSSEKYPYDGNGSSTKGLAGYLKEENDYWVAALADIHKKVGAEITKKYESRIEGEMVRARTSFNIFGKGKEAHGEPAEKLSKDEAEFLKSQEFAAELQKRVPGVDPTRFAGWVRRGGVYQVNFIDSDAIEDIDGEDEHPPGVPQMGQRFTYDFIKNLMANQEVWKRSALFITYDEHGGFYDHLPPPPACEPDDPAVVPIQWSGRYGSGPLAYKTKCFLSDGTLCSADNIRQNPKKTTGCAAARLSCGAGDRETTDQDYGGAFNRYGVRVPFIVVSPWAKRHYVSHHTYDHTSIVRFIQARHNLPALTARDANADALFDLFDFTGADEKLASADWGKMALPAEYPSRTWHVDAHGKPDAAKPFTVTKVPEAEVAHYGFTATGAKVSATEKFAMKAPKACYDAMRPSTSFGGALGDPAYPGWDWPEGIAPPPNYSTDDATVGRGESKIRRRPH